MDLVDERKPDAMMKGPEWQHTLQKVRANRRSVITKESMTGGRKDMIGTNQREPLTYTHTHTHTRNEVINQLPNYLSSWH